MVLGMGFSEDYRRDEAQRNPALLWCVRETRIAGRPIWTGLAVSKSEVVIFRVEKWKQLRVIERCYLSRSRR
jgi:hypothetical protein